MNKNEFSIKSILILDDEQSDLDLYAGLLQKHTKAHIVKTKFPSDAIKQANKHFFDIILIDVTMTFHGTQFGGFEVYKSLMNRYGSSSLIVYSQFITDDLLKQFNYDFNFIEKGDDPKKFVLNVIKYMNKLRKEQTCFIAMPFAAKYNRILGAIKKGVNSTFYKFVRVDEQVFNDPITAKIFREIEQAKLIIFLATDQNPNAFYECGFAIALQKEVITLTDGFHNLPFDIKDRNAIGYGDDLGKLELALHEKLDKLTRIS